MRYVMQEKVFTLGDHFTIRDEQGRDRYLVECKAFSLVKELALRDLAGHELAHLRQKMFTWGPRSRSGATGRLRPS